MIYKADQDGVKNLHINANGIVTFKLNDIEYFTIGLPFINQGGTPVEAYYEQRLYTLDPDDNDNLIHSGHLKYTLIEWTNENDPNKYHVDDESLACNWEKFEVYLHD